MAVRDRKLYAAPAGLRDGEEMLLSVAHNDGKVTVWFRPVTRKLNDGPFSSESFMMFDGRDKFAKLADMPRFNQKKFDAIVSVIDTHKDALAAVAAGDLTQAAMMAQTVVQAATLYAALQKTPDGRPKLDLTTAVAS